MTTLRGDFYAQGSSRKWAAALSFSDDSYYLKTDDGEHRHVGNARELSVSSRLGSVPRKFELPDAGIFETPDNDAVDALLRNLRHQDQHGSLLYWLESRWSAVLISFIAVLFFLVGGIGWGIPAASEAIAHRLPVSMANAASKETLALLDKIWLQPSTLSDAQQKTLNARFEQLLPPPDDTAFTYQLHFRSLPDSPNAFALPSGDIVLTDELVALADHDDEVDSVLLHEIAHVEKRHGLQQVVSSSIFSIGVAMMTGDVTGGAELLTGLPVFLVQQNYSRGAESEADAYAVEMMLRLDRDPRCFGSMMRKLSASESDETKNHGIGAYFSSHPASQARIAYSIAAAEAADVRPGCIDPTVSAYDSTLRPFTP